MGSMHAQRRSPVVLRMALWLALISLGLPVGGQAQDAAEGGSPYTPVASDGADAAEGVSPHTPVASDGAVVAEGQEAASGLTSIEAFEGSAAEESTRAQDRRAEFAEETESAEEVWALWNLAPATGKEGIETIIGADDRVRVNPTTTYPARAVALITFNGGRCTGWLIGANTVATAGHCVHTGGPGGAFRTNVRVYPGRNGTSAPFGSCSARRLFTVAGWVNSSDERFDYGAIKLNCTIGNTTGWFGFFWQSASLTGQPSILNGYPGDKPLTQWRSVDAIRVTQSQQVFYANDTLGGMSGAPVYFNKSGCGFCSLAIHTYGLHGGFPHSRYNHGTRITQTVFNNLVAWRNAP